MIEPIPSLSAIICTYSFNRFDDVVEAIRSLQGQRTAPSEIIVVVDHNPELAATLERFADDRVVVIENHLERGLSGARNAGIARARGDLLIFLDDDAVADPDCVGVVVDRFRDPTVIGVGGRIEPQWLTSRPQWFPPEFLWVVGCTYVGLEPGVTRNLLGAMMCIRRDVFDRIDGFDGRLGRTQSGLPLGCEETELCIRAARAIDGRFVYDPAARVRHKVPAARGTFRYFVERCFGEGISKARLSDMIGSERAVGTERAYVLRTLIPAVARGVADLVLRGDVGGSARAGAVVAGLAATVAGFALGLLGAFRTPRPAEPVDTPARPTGDGAKPTEAPPSTATTPPRARTPNRFTAAWLTHRVLFENAGLLAMGTGTSAALGFVYWWLAARTFPPAAIGYAAAAISLMNFIGHLGEVGFGALLLGENGRGRDRRAPLISTGLTIAFAASAMFGLAYLGVATLLPIGLGGLGLAFGSAVFVLGCAFTGFTLVLDQALVGLLRSRLQVSRNVSFAVSKLVFLAAAPLWIGMASSLETGILSTWIAGQIVSILLLAATARRSLPDVVARPDFAVVRPRFAEVLGHHGLNLASLAPGLLLPFVVTISIAATTNAAFYAAWTLVNVAYLVPAALATVVYAVGSKNPGELSAKLRASLGTSAGFAVIVAVICIFAGDFVLSMFTPLYAVIAGRSFALLGLSVLPIALKYHYVSIQRIRGRMTTAGLLVAVGAGLELGGAIIGGRRGDLQGLTIGWLAGLAIEVALILPVIVDALRGEPFMVGGADFSEPSALQIARATLTPSSEDGR